MKTYKEFINEASGLDTSTYNIGVNNKDYTRYVSRGKYIYQVKTSRMTLDGDPVWRNITSSDIMSKIDAAIAGKIKS